MGTVDRSMWVQTRYYTDDDRGTTSAYHKKYAKTYKLVRTRTGVSNPHWKQAIAEHKQAGTALSGTFESIDVGSMSSSKAVTDVAMPPRNVRTYSVRGNVAASRISFTFHGADMLLGPAQDLARSRALKQIKKARQKMSGGVFLGELREAVSMLRRPAEGLRKAIKEQYLDQLKRRTKGLKSPRTAPERWKEAISQTWLEGCFGWLPLVNDLEDAAKAYRALQVDEPRYEKIRAVGKLSEITYQYKGTFAPVSDFYHLEDILETQSAICIIRGEVLAQAETTKLEKARLFGLSAGEFAPTVWELLPWSFLVDYFTNIGDIIDNATTDTTGVTWLNQSNVRVRQVRALVRAMQKGESGLNSNALYVNSKSSDRTTFKRKIVSRTQNVSLEVPPLTFELPSSPLKLLNMAALWLQANKLFPQDARALRGRHIS